MRLQDQIKQIMGDPNALTLFRILAVPLIVILLLMPNRLICLLAAIIFSAAAITDYFDGLLARQKGMITNLGKVMDPVADKLLVSSTFIMLTSLGWVPAWVVCIIIGRELAVTGLRNLIGSEPGRCFRIVAGQIQDRFSDRRRYSFAAALFLFRVKFACDRDVFSMGCTAFYPLVGNRLFCTFQTVIAAIIFY